MGLELDLRNRDYDDLDKLKFAGPGWAKVELIGASVCPDTGATVLQFAVLAHSAGDFAGCMVEERLKDPARLHDRVKARKASDRAEFWAKRLGAITPQDAGTRVKPNFPACVGGVYVLRIETRTFQQGGVTKTFTGP